MIHHLYDYRDYKQYVKHQLSKTKSGKIQEREARNYAKNVQVFKDIYQYWFFKYMINPLSALCIGARSGAEVEALIDLGVPEAVGVDLAVHEPYVMLGDMHALPFENDRFDFIFCNVFDHSSKPDVAAQQIHRVAQDGAHVLLQLAVGPTDDKHAAIAIDRAEDITGLFNGEVRAVVPRDWRGSINTEVLLWL